MLFVVYSIIYICRKIKKKLLKKKILNLLPFQQKIIHNYLSNVSSKYTIEKENEAFKLISLISLLNYSEISNKGTISK